jgi:hypothetical protein
MDRTKKDGNLIAGLKDDSMVTPESKFAAFMDRVLF